jgi:hypothetical protein
LAGIGWFWGLDNFSAQAPFGRFSWVRGLDSVLNNVIPKARGPRDLAWTTSHFHLLSFFFTVDLAGDFVLMSDYTGKEVVE